MPPAEPLGPALRALDDAEVERRAADDPDAGAIPPGFWDGAWEGAEQGDQVTLRLDADVLRHFRATGAGYRARMSAVLRDYVRALGKPR